MTGWTAGRVGYLIAGAGVLGAALMLIVASFSDRSARPQRYVVSGYLVMGVCVLAAGLHLHGWSGTAALLLFMVIYYAIQAPMLRAMTTVVPGKGSAVAIGAINTCGITGGFIGPYWMGWMRDATGSYAWGVGALCVPAVFAAVMMMYLMREKQRTSIVQVEIGFEEEAVG
jgi:ACS family tartrate transporter-like MFS transporter